MFPASVRDVWKPCGMSLRFLDRLAVVPQGRSTLAAAAATWLGALVGMAGRSPFVAVVAAVLVAGGAVGAQRRRVAPLLAALVAAGFLSGAAAAERIAGTLAAAVTPGQAAFAARVIADPVPGTHQFETLVRPMAAGPTDAPLLVATDDRPLVAAGDVVGVEGMVRHRPGRLRGDPYAGVVVDAEVGRMAAPSHPALRLGNALRSIVLDRLQPRLPRPGAALLAGFLVGDTSYSSRLDLENLRSAGLTHYVAVSGSNVALFLAAWWLVAGPLPLGPRFRAATGLAALAVFVAATRWEPSVVRASTMAGVVLAGRIAGVPVEPWRALGSAVTLLLLVSGDLSTDVGFQLSVCATTGVLVGGRMPLERRPRWMWRSLAVTAGAQLAVVPILLSSFGRVPLLSPLANVAAAPFVTVATVAGGVGLTLGMDAVVAVAMAAADGVLLIASTAAGWPQLGPSGVVAALVVVAGLRSSRWRLPVVAALAGWTMVAALPAPQPPWPVVTFLHVGQGDAIVLRSPGGGVVLVDGGSDPEVLGAALARHGVAALELLVVTHGDQDHAGGIVGLAATMPIAELWYPAQQDLSALLQEVLTDAAARGIPATAVRTGRQHVVGALHLQVLGPGRRFAAENDGSIVLWVSGPGATALLTGDVEAVAQEELPALRPDVLQVPHHGSNTTDLAWLRRTVGEVAVISVGPNTFGHPTAEVLAALHASGVAVYQTRHDGDVTMPLCRPCEG